MTSSACAQGAAPRRSARSSAVELLAGDPKISEGRRSCAMGFIKWNSERNLASDTVFLSFRAVDYGAENTGSKSGQ